MTVNDKPQVDPVRGAESSSAGAISPDCAAIMVYATFPSLDAAAEVGKSLVQERLAGCINILPGMTSIYPWEGKIETATEAVLIAKTIPARAGRCIDFIRARHVYEVPAILVLPVIGGSADYLKWLCSGIAAGP